MTASWLTSGTYCASVTCKALHADLTASRCTDVAETGLSAPGGAAAALLAEPGRTTTRSAARHEAGDVPQPKPDAKDTVLEGDRISRCEAGMRLCPALSLLRTVRCLICMKILATCLQLAGSR